MNATEIKNKIIALCGKLSDDVKKAERVRASDLMTLSTLLVDYLDASGETVEELCLRCASPHVKLQLLEDCVKIGKGLLIPELYVKTNRAAVRARRCTLAVQKIALKHGVDYYDPSTGKVVHYKIDDPFINSKTEQIFIRDCFRKIAEQKIYVEARRRYNLNSSQVRTNGSHILRGRKILLSKEECLEVLPAMLTIDEASSLLTAVINKAKKAA